MIGRWFRWLGGRQDSEALACRAAQLEDLLRRALHSAKDRKWKADWEKDAEGVLKVAPIWFDIEVSKDIPPDEVRFVDARGQMHKIINVGPLDADAYRALKLLYDRADSRAFVLNDMLEWVVKELGGQVDGEPTSRVNFLRRIRELRKIEARAAGEAMHPCGHF